MGHELRRVSRSRQTACALLDGMDGSVWTSSNLLSLSRAVLAVPIGWLLLLDTGTARGIAAGLIVVAAATDFFDGFLARRLLQVTDLGRIIDPAADKFAVGVVALILAVEGKLPLWFLVGVIARDGLILAGGAYIRKSRGVVLQSNWPGKTAVGILALLIFLLVLDLPALELYAEVLLYVTAGLLMVSFVVYTFRFVEVTREAHG